MFGEEVSAEEPRNLFEKECGASEFEEEEFEGIEDDKDDDDDDRGKQRREKLSSKSSVSSQSYSFEQAIRCYSEAVRMDREDVASWLRMGELSAKRGDVALARMAFESGLLAQPTHALLLNELCEVCVLVGDEASAAFLAARILNSDRRNERMKEIQTNFANAKPKERLVKARERFERVNARKDISAKGTKCALTLERMAWDDVASSILSGKKSRLSRRRARYGPRTATKKKRTTTTTTTTKKALPHRRHRQSHRHRREYPRLRGKERLLLQDQPD